MSPPNYLPPSSTKGLGKLDEYAEGGCFTNMPPCPQMYVSRVGLETELRRELLGRPEVITLSGRGGIGKTSLTLSVLHEVANEDIFDIIIWFSARTVDLLISGPKLVQPDVLTTREIAKEFARLTEPEGWNKPRFDSLANFREALTEGAMGGRTLFVFDNFETVEDKGEVLFVLLVVADDFGATDVGASHAPVRGVEDEKPARHPFVDVVGEYLDGRCIRGRNGIPLVDPLADDDPQEFVLGPRPGLLLLALHFVAPLGSSTPFGRLSHIGRSQQ